MHFSMKRLSLILAATLIMVACGSKNATDTTSSTKADSICQFENEWFSIKYPSFLKVYTEENDTQDTIPFLKEGGSVTICNDILPYRIYIVKSVSPKIFETPEEWRDFAIESKNFISTDGVEYLDVLETRDSVYFYGNPAASVMYEVRDEYGTIQVQHQTVVLRENDDLYYINFFAPKDEYSQYSPIGLSIINTLKFK